MKATNRSLSNAPFPGSVFHAHPSYSIHNMASSNTHKLLRHKNRADTYFRYKVTAILKNPSPPALSFMHFPQHHTEEWYPTTQIPLCQREYF